MNFLDRSMFEVDLQDAFHPDEIAWVLDPVLAKAEARRSEWILSNARLRESGPDSKSKAEDLDRKEIKHRTSLHEYVRKRRQWAALRELRSEFALRNQHLQDLISQSNHPTLKHSLLDYNDLTDMLDTGILTSSSILYGLAPSSMKQVPAVTNLTYSAATVMRKHGRPTSFNPSALDFVQRRRSVPKPHHPQFDILVRLMYPEMHHEYDERICMTPSSPDDVTFHFGSTTGEIFAHSELDKDFDFSSFDDIFNEFMDPQASEEKAGQFHTSADAPNQERNDDQLLYLDSSELPTPDLPKSQNDVAETLRNTVIFAILLQFLIYISQLGFLLWTLGYMPDSHSLDDLGRIISRLVTSSFLRYIDVLRSRVALLLALDPELLLLRPLVTIALKLVGIRWVTSIRAFEITLSVLRVKIMECCSVAARVVDPEYIGNTNHDSIEDYGSIPVQSREEHHMNAFRAGENWPQLFDSDSESSFEALTNDSNTDLLMTDVPCPGEQESQFDPFAETSRSNNSTDTGRDLVSLVQIQDQNATSSLGFPKFDFSIPMPDFPEANEILRESAALTGLSTPTASLTPQPTKPSPSPTTQRRLCNIPAATKLSLASKAPIIFDVTSAKNTTTALPGLAPSKTAISSPHGCTTSDNIG
ncbi:MAG: hypothetical protein Q9226_003251 [Calogaya cf. arnoldii]